MNATIGLRLFEITKEFVNDNDKAKEFVAKIEETIDNKFEESTATLATKDDLRTEVGNLKIELANNKNDLLKTIYIVGLAQFLAIIGAVLAIINFMQK